MDRIDQLRIFVRIAACGSFSKAAAQLEMPRATVSVAMQQLEAKLGARLLHRTTRRVSLTQDGEALLDSANGLVEDMEEIERQFRPVGRAIAGRLRVDVPSRIARRLIAPALPEFLNDHPEIQVDLGSSDRIIDLVENGIDCALRVGELMSNSLVARPLGSFELINCASPTYLARQGTPRSPRDLNGHLTVDYVSSASGKADPWEWAENGETHFLQVRSRVSVNNAETYIACGLAGLGMIQIPRFDVMDLLETGELVEVMPDARPPPMPVHLVYPHRKHLSRRVQAFLSWIEDLLVPLILTDGSR